MHSPRWNSDPRIVGTLGALVAMRGHISARDLVVELKSEGIAHPPLEERVFLRPSALQSWSVVRYTARTSLAARTPLAMDVGVDAHAAT